MSTDPGGHAQLVRLFENICTKHSEDTLRWPDMRVVSVGDVLVAECGTACHWRLPPSFMLKPVTPDKSYTQHITKYEWSSQKVLYSTLPNTIFPVQNH